MDKVNVTAQHIASLKPMEVVKDDTVRRRFIDLYGALWDEATATAVYEREAIHFNRLLADNPSLKTSTPVSVFIAFIDLAVCGLSVEPGVRALAYLQPRRYKTGATDDHGKDIYEQRCTLTISGYGELVQRARSGQIRHADNPVIVYEGDGFSFSDRGGVKTVDYTLNINHNTCHPVACFMKITRADGSIDYSVMLEEDWRRLAEFSGKSNKKWDATTKQFIEKPNELYTSGEGSRIDSGFLVAKCIKHAFKTYPKVRIGRGTTYEADIEPARDEDYYGIDEPADNTRDNPVAQPQQPTAGVVIDIEQDDTDDTF